MNADSETYNDSVGEFGQGRESDNSSCEAPMVPASMPRKKTRADAVPFRSTPKSFTFTENDDDMIGTPIMRRKRLLTPAIEADLASLVAAIQANLKELMQRNAELARTNVRQQQQIAELTKRVTNLEGRHPQESEQKIKVRNAAKHAVRVAVSECEVNKGIVLDLGSDLRSTNNAALRDYCWNYAKTVLPDIALEEFSVALKRYFDSQKERNSRDKRGKLQAHKDGQRKNQRKRRKSSNRVEGLNLSDLPQHVKRKYRPALEERDLVSTEESDVDEEGERIFTTKKRAWESAELANAKRIADAAFARKSATSSAAKTRRKKGVSDAPVPALVEEKRWVLSTDYGMI